MLMTDGEIRDAIDRKEMVIQHFSEDCLEPASYDMRIGKKALVTSTEDELDLEHKHSLTLKAGDFALITTHEVIKLSNTIAGHIGIKSYYTRKGIVILAGLQIDPGFEGVLVLGIYNASPRSFTLDYLAPFCTVEFHKLARPAIKLYISGEEQKRGDIPRADKDYLRTLETETLSGLSAALRQMSINVSDLTTTVKTMSNTTYYVIVPLLVLIVAVILGLPFLIRPPQ